MFTPQHPWESVISSPFHPNTYRLFSRLRAPVIPGEVRRIERWLASARVFLAISALVALWMDPGELGYSPWAYWILGVYIVHGVVVMLLLRFRKESTPAFRMLVHSGDILWPILMVLFATTQGGPFLLFFVFVLAAAAYRWGLWETFGTAMATVVLLWLESLAINHGGLMWLDGKLTRHGLLPLKVQASQFDPKRLFMLSAYLLVMGLLLGYLAEQQKRLRAERAIITRVLGRARVEAGLTVTLQEILAELTSMYGARRALIASQETNKYRVFVGDLQRVDSGPAELRWLESLPTDREMYLYETDADASLVIRKSEVVQVISLDREGSRLRNSSDAQLEALTKVYPYNSLMAVSFLFGQEWWGRIFLLDPVLGGDREEELRFLQELVRQVGPAVYNVYLLRRLRQRAGAVERARVARELHDGAVQSLIAMEMQVDVVRRQSASQSSPITSELGRIQGLLREEVLKLRELMQQMKSLEVDSSNFIRFLLDTVERFQRETGIGARFVSAVEHVHMPPRVCRELARIVQEGLVNVRKHSGAKDCLVRFADNEAQWILTIEDNGRAFPFSGTLSPTDSLGGGKGPTVIMERVRLIEGALTIESNPGQGARLEVRVPKNRDAEYGQ
ncbi:MAG TPA: histidine kinase [Terriglobales bacterium]|nr:histidine kinase [Terriglobales bacterium]